MHAHIDLACFDLECLLYTCVSFLICGTTGANVDMNVNAKTMDQSMLKSMVCFLLLLRVSLC